MDPDRYNGNITNSPFEPNNVVFSFIFNNFHEPTSCIGWLEMLLRSMLSVLLSAKNSQKHINIYSSLIFDINVPGAGHTFLYSCLSVIAIHFNAETSNLWHLEVEHSFCLCHKGYIWIYHHSYNVKQTQ